ncbi:hypothetical protein ACWCZ5_23990, partial [Streptomyces sp. NPDC001667]
FGTLLSSQGTDASFVLTLSGFPPGASLRYFVFRLYQILFRAVPGWNFVSDPRRRGVHYFSGFPVRLLIEPIDAIFRHSEI